MAYQGYSDQPAAYGQSNPYGNPSPYGQAGNPYDDNNNSYGNRQDPYSAGQYDRQGYEMGNVNASDPNRILNQCQALNNLVDQLEQQRQRLWQMQSKFIDDPSADARAGSQAVTQTADDLLQQYRDLVSATKTLKQDKESGHPRNAAQVGKLDRRVKQSMTEYQKQEAAARQQLEGIIRRNYLHVNPEASEAEIREVIQDPHAQVYSQAVMQSSRRGEAAATRQHVADRHKAIQKIASDMEEVAKMFQDLDALVIQQEAAVTSIEQRGEEVTDHVAKANTELDGAVTKARAARKKKWICLGIAVLIVIIIVVVVVVAVLVTRNN